MIINGKTGLTGLLGSPVGHSKSPMMHNTSFQELGINYVYLCFDVGIEGLSGAVDGLVSLGAKGWNCTMPNKSKMARLCDVLSPAASITGSVNTVVNENGKLMGYNTDGTGYMRAVKEAGFSIKGEKMTLLGAGGAATSILVQAALDGVREISVFCRPGKSTEHARQVINQLTKQTACKINLFDYSDESVIKKELLTSRILTNGTNVGMAPDTDRSLSTSADFFHPDLIVSDVIYNPRETKLMEIVKLIGSDVLPDDQKLILEIARVIRLGFLQQNAFHADDTCVPLEKQYKMMEIILYLYKKAKALVTMGMPMSVLKEDNIFEKIIAIKYDVPNDKPEMFDDYKKAVDIFYDKVLEKNG